MLAFLAGVIYCLIENRSAMITISLIAAALLAGLSSRMRGKWGYQSGTVSVGGEFADPFGPPQPPTTKRTEPPPPGPAL
jgi:hypothetical protein